MDNDFAYQQSNSNENTNNIHSDISLSETNPNVIFDTTAAVAPPPPIDAPLTNGSMSSSTTTTSSSFTEDSLKSPRGNRNPVTGFGIDAPLRRPRKMDFHRGRRCAHTQHTFVANNFLLIYFFVLHLPSCILCFYFCVFYSISFYLIELKFTYTILCICVEFALFSTEMNRSNISSEQSYFLSTRPERIISSSNVHALNKL